MRTLAQGPAAERKREAARIRYQQKREEIKAQTAKYRRENQDKVRAYRAKHAKENAEVIGVYMAAYRANHREEARELSRRWRAENPERLKALVEAWHRERPEARRIMKANRRARIIAGAGSIPIDFTKKLFKLQSGKCPNCKCSLKDGFHLDHIVALSRGGLHSEGNLQLLCPTCNLKKSNKDPLVWAVENGRLL